MADDGYTYARPDAEEIDEPDPTFDVLTDYTVDLDNPIGVGGFGSVHFGCQRSTRKMVAVKAGSKARTQQAAERGAAHTSAEEILKMEIEVSAPCGGVVGEVAVTDGQQVAAGDLLLAIG